MPRQNAVLLSKQAEFTLCCEAYNENDADRQAIKQATDEDVMKWARICNCHTCSHALINIADAETGMSNADAVTDVYRQMRHNKKYYLQKLREYIASRTVKHNLSNFNKETL